MKRGLLLIVLISCIILLSGCDKYERVEEVKLVPESELQSVTYKIWTFPNVEISMQEDTCMNVVDDYKIYLDYSDEKHYNVYAYNDGYVGILAKDNEVNVCSDFLPIYGGVHIGEEFFPEFDFDSKNNVYYKNTDEMDITVHVNEEGFITYYKADTDEYGLLFEMYNFNSVDFTIPNYETYTSIGFVLSHYGDLNYVETENTVVFENSDWIASLNIDTKSIAFESKNIDLEYTFINGLFSVIYNEAFLTLDDIFPSENEDKEFFRLVIEIQDKEKNITDYFDIPEIENNYTAPGSSN